MRLPSHFVRRLASITTAGFIFTLGACNDDPASPIEGAGDPEVISRVEVRLTAPNGSIISSVRVDPDGSQLPQPVGAAQGTLTLTKGSTYQGTVLLSNTLDPKHIIDISAEVRKESNFHRFFYTTTCAGVTIPDAGLDLDTQSPIKYPVGLVFQIVVAPTAATSTTCMLRVELRHFEAAKGNGLGSTFDTDLSIDFPVTVN